MAATCCRSLLRPAFSILKSTISKAYVTKPLRQSASPSSVLGIPKSSSSTSRLSRPLPQMGSLQSLLPIHTAVSSARFKSCLGLDSKGSRSLSQGMRASPGVWVGPGDDGEAK